MILRRGYSISKIIIARRHDEAICFTFSFGETPNESVKVLNQVQNYDRFNPLFIDNVINKVRYQLKAVAENAGILRCALNDTPLWPPCYPAWEMMEGEAVEIFALTFNYPQPQVAQMAL